MRSGHVTTAIIVGTLVRYRRPPESVALHRHPAASSCLMPCREWPPACASKTPPQLKRHALAVSVSSPEGLLADGGGEWGKSQCVCLRPPSPLARRAGFPSKPRQQRESPRNQAASPAPQAMEDAGEFAGDENATPPPPRWLGADSSRIHVIAHPTSSRGDAGRWGRPPTATQIRCPASWRDDHTLPHRNGLGVVERPSRAPVPHRPCQRPMWSSLSRSTSRDVASSGRIQIQIPHCPQP